MRVNGPYTHNTGILKGRRYVNIVYDNGKKTTKMYARYLMEQHLGRELSPEESVDHIDEDFTNDSIENLQVLSLAENSRKSNYLRRPAEYWTFNCPWCQKEFTKPARFVRWNNITRKKFGPFCGKKCAGAWTRHRQLLSGQVNLVGIGRKRRVAELVNAVDLGSTEEQSSCGFESRPSEKNVSPSQFPSTFELVEQVV